MRSWLEESKRFLLPLADAASGQFHSREFGSQKDDATTDEIRSTLRSLQQSISANPCPDGTWTVRAQLETLAGRYGFLALVLETKHKALDEAELVALGDHLDATNLRLRALIADLERGLEGEETNDARD
jgi:hypothetical protein